MKKIIAMVTLLCFLSPGVALADFMAPPGGPPGGSPAPKASAKSGVKGKSGSGGKFAAHAGISFGVCIGLSAISKENLEDEDFLGCGAGALAGAAVPGLGFFANQFTRCVIRGEKYGWEKDYAGWSVKGPRRGGCNNDAVILEALHKKWQSGQLTRKEKRLYKRYVRKLRKRR